MATQEQKSPDEVAAQARAVIRGRDRAALATLTAEGAPYASLVMVALDAACRPLLLISELAEHTKNLRGNPRASLLFDATAGLDNPLTGARVTVQGEMAPCNDKDATARYVRRHPEAEIYLGFRDFALWRMALAKAHMVAGFGAINWIEGDVLLPRLIDAPDLAEAEADICEHMNADHADALALIARHVAGQDRDGWIMTGIDPEGCDLRLGGTVARAAFPTPISGPGEAREALVALTSAARKTADAID